MQPEPSLTTDDGGRDGRTPQGAPRGPVTLRDVARRAGVAVSTASRALGQPGRVSAATREQVAGAAQELGYVPSAHAKALRSGRTSTVALLVPDITNPYFFGVIRGTQFALKTAGYTHVLLDTEESAEAEHLALDRLRGQVDGVLLAAPRLDDDALLGWAERVPLVAVNRSVPGPTVGVDIAGGLGHVLDHLVSLGHRRIAYAAGPPTSWSSQLREQHLARRAVELGLDLVVLGPYPPRRTAGPAAADAVVHSGATAVLAFNDLIAIGILERLAERGLAVPGDVSVVGCDDIFGADLCSPALTTISADVEGLGAAATAALLAKIDPARHPQRNPVALAAHLTIRRSTGPAT